MFKKKTNYPNDSKKVDTLIGKETTITGAIKGIGIIRVDGQVEGDIITEGDVIIGGSGSVTGNIRSKNVTIAGTINGNVVCQNRLEIGVGGILVGDVKTAALIIDDGAHFTGNCEMKKGQAASAEGRAE